MALIISIVSQKGGVGKSTLVRCLAVEFARKDWSVLIADTDLQQGTILDWNRVRQEQNHLPAIEVQSFGRIQDITKKADQFDVIIIDGAGQATPQTLEFAKVSNIVLLPSGLSRDDLFPQIRLANELVSKSVPIKKIGIVFSRVGSSERELEDAKDTIKQMGYKFVGKIPEKTSISQCQDNGLSANETKYESINMAVDACMQGVVDLIKINQ